MPNALEDILNEARRVRFGELVNAYGGPTEFAREVERRLAGLPALTDLRSFMDVSYVSRAKNAGKNNKAIGEATAMQLEFLFEKEKGWMAGDAFDNFLIRLRRTSKAG